MSDPNEPQPPGSNSEGQPQFRQSHGGGESTFRPSGGSGTSSPTLKALTLADVLDYTFRLYRAEWKPVIMLTLALSIPAAVVAAVLELVVGNDASGFSGGSSSVYTSFLRTGSGGIALTILLSLLSFIISVVFNPLISGSITRVVAASYLGRKVDAGQAVRSMLPLWFTLVIVSIITSLAVFVPMITCILIPLGIAVAVVFSLVVPVIAVEEVSIGDALSRSIGLAKQRFWMYLGTLVVTYIAFGLLAFIAQTIPDAVGSAIDIAPLTAIFSALAVLLGGVVSTPLSAIVHTLLYFDARVRFEGFDLQMMSAAMNPVEGGNIPPRNEPPASPSPDQGPVGY